jgi:hypothetical protein
VGQDLVCLLSEKFLDKVKIRYIVSHRSRVCWRPGFLREMSGHTLFKRGLKKEGLQGACPFKNTPR